MIMIMRIKTHLDNLSPLLSDLSANAVVIAETPAGMYWFIFAGLKISHHVELEIPESSECQGGGTLTLS